MININATSESNFHGIFELLFRHYCGRDWGSSWGIGGPEEGSFSPVNGTGVWRRCVRLISLPDILEEEEMVGGGNRTGWLRDFLLFLVCRFLGLISYSPPDSLPPERYE